MTKNLFALICFVLCTQLSFANKVDDLKTDQDVLNFVKSADTSVIKLKNFPDIKIPSTERIIADNNCDSLVKTWGIKNWLKADFNADGRTDLLVTVFWYGYRNFVFIDNGNNTFSAIEIKSFNTCELINTLKSYNKQLIIFHYRKYIPPAIRYEKGKTISETHTLIYKFNTFVELNLHPAKYNIDSIIYFTSKCMGTCPTFKMSIAKNGHAIFDAGLYNKEQGLFSTKIDANDLNELFALINYINVKKLKNEYYVDYTDLSTCTLKIKFSDGSTKFISDYGKRGTFGLARLYALLFNLRDSQNWAMVK